MSEYKTNKNKSRRWIDQIQSFNELYRNEEDKDMSSRKKLGWVRGVLISCLLNTWSAILFFRMPWMLGQTEFSIIVIFLSLFIILFTNFSLCAISSNGKIKEGGLYFILSRSIGPEFGASIGIILAFANISSAVLNTYMFCLFLYSSLQSNGIHNIINNSNFSTGALGVVSIIIMSIIGCVGMDIEAGVEYALLTTIIVGIFNVIIGPKSNLKKKTSFTKHSMKDYHLTYNGFNDIVQTFFATFARFFPTVTSINAGLKYSPEDLKNPSASIPKGTLYSILITATSYIVLIITPKSVEFEKASGYENKLHDGSFSNCSFTFCDKGLYNAINPFRSISYWPNTIDIGCIAATISKALSAIILVPKLLQRMGKDDVLPFFKYLAKSEGPCRAHVFAVILLSVLFIIGFFKFSIGDISELTTICYLSAYAMLNLCTFHVAYYNPLGWRPSYKLYHRWLSVATAGICVSLMLLIDEIISIIVICAIIMLALLAYRKNEAINWGSSVQMFQLKLVIKNVYKTNSINYHVKNYLPNLIIFSGNPESRKYLVSLANLITKKNGVQMCVNIEKAKLTLSQKKICLKKGIQWLKNSRIKSLYVVIDNTELDLATRIIYSCGHGQLKPNIAMVGYKSDWLNCPYQDLQAYLNIFNVSHMNNISTIMVRVSSTEIYNNKNSLIQDFKHLDKNEDIPCKTQSNQNLRNQQKVADSFVKIKNNEFLFETKKRKNGTVDVWWLYNDGGVSLVIALILKRTTAWRNCKFRIFGVTTKTEWMFEEKQKLKKMLSLYRVKFDYFDIILAKTTSPTLATTLTYFNSLLEHSDSKEFVNCKNNKMFFLEKEHFSKTLFLRDPIKLHSSNSELIILTAPKNNEEINLLFMCWIETISRGLPPCLIVHGRSGPVLAIDA